MLEKAIPIIELGVSGGICYGLTRDNFFAGLVGTIVGALIYIFVKNEHAHRIGAGVMIGGICAMVGSIAATRAATGAGIWESIQSAWTSGLATIGISK